MSLTSVLCDKNHQELRDKFKTEFLRPVFEVRADIKAPPLTNNNGLVGTAFDYLLRFYLQYHNSENCILPNDWVADLGFGQLQTQLIISPQKKISTGFREERVFDRQVLLSLVTEQYKQAKANHVKYITDGVGFPENSTF